MNTIPIGTKVTTIYEPDKVGMVKSIKHSANKLPLYTIAYPDGNEYANYEDVLRVKTVTSEDVLRYGEYLTDEQIHHAGTDTPVWTRIRTIRYEGHVYYHKMVDGEVVEFKELI